MTQDTPTLPQACAEIQQRCDDVANAAEARGMDRCNYATDGRASLKALDDAKAALGGVDEQRLCADMAHKLADDWYASPECGKDGLYIAATAAIKNARAPLLALLPAQRGEGDDVERVARAIYEDAHKGLKNCWKWDDSGLDDEHPGSRERYMRYARAAIAALPRSTAAPSADMVCVPREPTPQMIAEGFEAIRMEEKWPTLIDRIYRAMLAASDERKGK